MNSIGWQLIVFFILTPALAVAAELELTKEQLANVNLTTATVTARESHARLKLNGVLTADQRKTHRVAPVVDGMVTELQVVAHERVLKGQILARLRSHSLGQAQADYLEALSRFELAQTERARIEGLWKEGVVAESRWLTVDSEYKSARAMLDARRRLLSLTGLSDQQIEQLANQPDRLAEFDLISPIDGVVTNVEIESGQLLSAGQAAFHVDDLSVLWAMVKIPVASLPQVKVGVEAVISVQATSQSYRGKLESLGGEVDAQSQTLTGRIVLDNPGGRLRPGMYAEVGLSGIARRGLMAPAGAVFRVGDQAYVFKVLGSGRFEPVAVEIGVEAEGWVPVRSGLAAGVEVVSGGVAELKSHWQYKGGE
ncbi:MAG: efflux RND transporter periplasmic adaptor subunit [Nitrospirota bacterium]